MVTSAPAGTLQLDDAAFQHEAFFYAGRAQFLEGATAFIRGAVEVREPVLVVVSARKIALLREQLGSAASTVRFADMADVGVNPARIIPAWAEFVSEHGDGPMRGIGEPIWAERSPEELVECQRHESLLNVAFAGSSGFRLMCPYDTTALGQDVIDEACRSHPLIHRDGARGASPRYPGVVELAGPCSASLPEPPGSPVEFTFRSGSLAVLRSFVWREADQAGMSPGRAGDMVTAVNEVASNSLRHAGGRGVVRMWRTPDSVICDVSDDGHIDDPLVGRVRPEVDDRGGRGLWMVNQLCELVQLRSTPTGTTVRMHFRRRPPV